MVAGMCFAGRIGRGKDGSGDEKKGGQACRANRVGEAFHGTVLAGRFRPSQAPIAKFAPIR